MEMGFFFFTIFLNKTKNNTIRNINIDLSIYSSMFNGTNLLIIFLNII